MRPFSLTHLDLHSAAGDNENLEFPPEGRESAEKRTRPHPQPGPRPTEARAHICGGNSSSFSPHNHPPQETYQWSQCMVIENRQRQQQQLPQELPSATSTVFRNNSKSARQKNTSKHIPQSIAGCLVIRLCASLSALLLLQKLKPTAPESGTRPARPEWKSNCTQQESEFCCRRARGKNDGSTSARSAENALLIGCMRASLYLYFQYLTFC